MKLFKKRSTLTPRVSIEENLVFDFCERFPFASYRPASYTFYREFQEKAFTQELEATFRALKESGAIDQGNVRAFQEVIFSRFKKALDDLDIQAARHSDINQRLCRRRFADRGFFEAKLKEAKNNLLILEGEYELLLQKKQDRR